MRKVPVKVRSLNSDLHLDLSLPVLTENSQTYSVGGPVG